MLPISGKIISEAEVEHTIVEDDVMTTYIAQFVLED